MKTVICILLLVLAFFAPVYAETIVFKTGKTVEGKIVERNDKAIKVDIIGIPVTYYLNDIESIDGNKIMPVEQTKPLEVKKEPPPVKEKINFEPFPQKKTISLGEVKEAQEDFQKGTGYFKEKKYDEAIAEFEKALKIDPEFAEGYYGLGYAYCYKNQCDAALPYFEKAIELSPNYADAINGLGYAYGNLGNYDKGIEYYLKTLKIKENNLDALNGLGYAYSSIGKYQEGINYFKKAIKVNPEYAPAYSGLGIVYYSLTQFLDAKENFLKARELYKKDNDEQGVKAIDEYLDKLPK
ncbi:MAG: tetratricopeptide repeat protein [Candidatus Omnitrophica bacterium]|nr:tetratricopeptide repeat protein [Candidatus Omnitrophota bacterium]